LAPVARHYADRIEHFNEGSWEQQRKQTKMKNTIKLIAWLAVLWFFYQARSHYGPYKALMAQAQASQRQHQAATAMPK
jgi:hypothetical protein